MKTTKSSLTERSAADPHALYSGLPCTACGHTFYRFYSPPTIIDSYEHARAFCVGCDKYYPIYASAGTPAFVPDRAVRS